MEYKYIVCCTLFNNNVLPFFAYTFSEATRFAEAVSKGYCVDHIEIHNIATGATFEYVA